ncbi:MAG: hypothetical protein ACOCV2_01530 [Persicimonas sp.]
MGGWSNRLRVGEEALLAALVVAASGLALGAPHLSPTGLVALYALLFFPWALLIMRADPGRLRWSYLIAAAVAVRLVFLFAEPVLSDDIFRYVWDGRVAAAGINPFAEAPASEALAHLRDETIWPAINHPEIPTIYPPIAQGLFRLNAALDGGTGLLRALLIAVEALGVGAIWLIFKKKLGGRPQSEVETADLKLAFATYALCPLVFVEIAFSGHVDVLAWAPLIVALLLFVRSRSLAWAAVAGAFCGVSIGAKFLGVLAVPLVVLWRRFDGVELSRAVWVGRRVFFVAAAAAVVVGSYVPYADAGSKLFSAFGTFSSRWESNAGPFRVASNLGESALERWAPVDESDRIERVDGELVFHLSHWDETFEKLGWTRTWRGRRVPATSFTAEQIAKTAARAAAAFVVGVVMLWAILTRRDPLEGMLAVLLTLFFVAPVVHPWYVAWLMPLAALRRWTPALVFSFVVLTAYLAWISYLNGGPWRVPDWALALEFGAVAAAVFWACTRHR